MKTSETPETRVFLVMELLEGATLRQHLEQKKKFATAQILQILGGRLFWSGSGARAGLDSPRPEAGEHLPARDR
jgi:hypothetical protein